MKLCIVRNAEARTNASIARIVNALENTHIDICLLTRNRYKHKSKTLKELKYKTLNSEISNYEIGLKSETGKGLANIVQLVIFQFFTFKWFLQNRDKYDIIHAFDLDAGLPTLLISKIFKKKYNYHIADFYVDSRGGIPKSIKKIIRQLEYLVINGAETTIICTEDREQQIKGSKPKNLVVIHNTPLVIEEIWKSKLNNINSPQKKSELILTYVGGLSETRFINSVINVIKKYPNVTLNLAGMGKLEDFVKQSSIDYKNINFLGRIDYNDALKLYSKTDLMFAVYNPDIPNHKFSAPNKVYEAMMLGKPIIVANGTGIDQLVINNNMGISIDYSEEAFEDVLKYIMSNPQIITDLSEKSRESYYKYSWSEMKNRILGIYNNI